MIDSRRKKFFLLEVKNNDLYYLLIGILKFLLMREIFKKKKTVFLFQI